MCCHAQSLPEGRELQQPVKSAEAFQHLGCNEAVEFRDENTPNESMMDVEYLQKDNSSKKPKHTENKLKTGRRKLDVDRSDKIKTDRTLKQFLNFSGQESISGNRENKLHAEQDNLMGSGNRSKEEESSRKDRFVSVEICGSVNNNAGEMLGEHIVNGERQKTEGVSKKLPEVEMIHKTTGKKCSRKAGNDVLTKEECEVQSETNFELTTRKGKITQKTGKHALDISPYKQQHFSPRTHFECQRKEHCFAEGNSHNTLNSEDREFQVYGEKGDALSGVRVATPLEKVACSFRELAVHNGSEKTKSNLQSVSNPGISGSVEKDTNKLHSASLDKGCFIAETEILEKRNLNADEARSTMREIFTVSSGNISENQCAAKVSESYPLDFEVSAVRSDPSLGMVLLGNAGDLNADRALSEITSGGEDNFPLSEHGLAKRLLSHDEKSLEKKEKQKKRNNNEEKRSTSIIKVPEFLCNADEIVNLRMILNQTKSTFESQNMSKSNDLKLIERNLNSEYANDVNYFAI
nr:PREDICTED: uncharacterized protein LOC104041173 [Phalacrocorax carbo]